MLYYAILDTCIQYDYCCKQQQYDYMDPAVYLGYSEIHKLKQQKKKKKSQQWWFVTVVCETGDISGLREYWFRPKQKNQPTIAKLYITVFSKRCVFDKNAYVITTPTTIDLGLSPRRWQTDDVGNLAITPTPLIFAVSSFVIHTCNA